MKTHNQYSENSFEQNESSVSSNSSFPEIEEERLRSNIYKSDTEKFHLLMKMFKLNALIKKAVVTHKQ